MASQSFVINEWLLHDLNGDNGPEAQKQSAQFLHELKLKCDRIAVLQGSPWMAKAYDLMKQDDPLRRGLSKNLHLEILRDSQKCKMLSPVELTALPENITENVPNKDRYLFQICFSAEADSLITTDQRLCSPALSSIVPANVVMRDEFLNRYLTRNAVIDSDTR